MEQVVIYLLMVQKLLILKQIILRIVANPTCQGNISKDWSVESMKRTWFNGCVYDFSVDYGAIAVDDILDIHKFFWKRITWYKNTWVYWKSVFYRINNFINL